MDDRCRSFYCCDEHKKPETWKDHEISFSFIPSPRNDGNVVYFWKVVGHFVVDWLKIIANCSCLRKDFFFSVFSFVFVGCVGGESADDEARSVVCFMNFFLV